MHNTLSIKEFKKRGNKYQNVSQVYNGYRYASSLEANFAISLDWRLEAGDIKAWERQVKIDIRVKKRHITNYFVDFKVIHNDDSIEYVETKGFETNVWRLKWKLFEALIDEIDPGATLTIVK